MAAPAQAQALLTQFNALSEATLHTYYSDCFLFHCIFLIFFHCNFLFFSLLEFATILIGTIIFFCSFRLFLPLWLFYSHLLLIIIGSHTGVRFPSRRRTSLKTTFLASNFFWLGSLMMANLSWFGELTLEHATYN